MSLSPEKVSKSGLFSMIVFTGISSARFNEFISSKAPLPQSTITGILCFLPRATNSDIGTDLVNPLTT